MISDSEFNTVGVTSTRNANLTDIIEVFSDQNSLKRARSANRNVATKFKTADSK